MLRGFSLDPPYIATRFSASTTGGLSRIASRREKIMALTPMVTAKVMITTIAKPRFLERTFIVFFRVSQNIAYPP
jgi:hypothetical protein